MLVLALSRDVNAHSCSIAGFRFSFSLHRRTSIMLILAPSRHPMSGNLFVTFQSHFPTFFDIWWHSMTFSHIFSHIWSHFKSNIWSHFWWHLITFHHIPLPFFWYFQHFQTFDNICRTYASHSMTFSANICSHFWQPNSNIYQHSITFRHLHLP